jgi:hypothetical protein
MKRQVVPTLRKNVKMMRRRNVVAKLASADLEKKSERSRK